MSKNTICVWYDKDAEAAARFYAETFPDSMALTVVPHSNTAKPSHSRSPPTIKRKPIATGTRSSATAGRRACAAGAKTDGVSRGKSHLAS